MEEVNQQDNTVSQTQATIFIKDNQLTKNFQDCIKHELYDLPLQQYLQKKYSWSEETILYIDWKAHSTLIGVTRLQKRELIY